jgi:hypothetical protein
MEGGTVELKNIVTKIHLKLMRYLVLIMEFLVLSIVFLQDLMDLLADVLNLLNEYSGFVDLRMNMGIFFLCGCKR